MSIEKKWKIISLGSKGMNKIYDPDGKDVTDSVKKVVCVISGEEIPKVYLEVTGEIDIQVNVVDQVSYSLFEKAKRSLVTDEIFCF